jgi:broad specificity phosphatase PhoE
MMNKMTNRLGQATLDAIHELKNRGIGRMAVIMRHSARHYDPKDWSKDPLMGLTDEGKEAAYAFGENLPTDSVTRLFSSPVGRCVETASQIEKGNASKGGKTEANKTIGRLATFFANDFLKAFEIIGAKGNAEFFRDWFSGKVPVDVMADPEASVAVLRKLLVDKLDEMSDNHIDILVSHDWSLYLFKEYCLGLAQEDVGKVKYLEGAIIYWENGDFRATNHQTESKVLGVPTE